MKPRTLVLFALISIVIPILVWAGGSHTTVGYTHSRTYLHSEAGDLRPPPQHEPVDPLTRAFFTRSRCRIRRVFDRLQP